MFTGPGLLPYNTAEQLDKPQHLPSRASLSPGSMLLTDRRIYSLYSGKGTGFREESISFENFWMKIPLMPCSSCCVNFFSAWAFVWFRPMRANSNGVMSPSPFKSVNWNSFFAVSMRSCSSTKHPFLWLLRCAHIWAVTERDISHQCWQWRNLQTNRVLEANSTRHQKHSTLNASAGHVMSRVFLEIVTTKVLSLVHRDWSWKIYKILLQITHLGKDSTPTF